MSASTLGQKAESCLKLILGMRLPAVAAALEPYGFSARVVEEGWCRLSYLTVPRLLTPPPPRLPYGALKVLYDFQTIWFGISRRVLRKSFPQVEKELFKGIRFVKGRAVLLNVTTFLNRLDELEQGGGEGELAVDALHMRGLTTEVMDAMRVVIQEMTIACPVNQLEAESLQREQRAVDEVWAWYLEWSEIARNAIRNKTLLHALGLVTRQRAESPEFVVVPVISTPSAPQLQAPAGLAHA